MPYRTRQGRRIILPAGATNGVQYLEKLEGTKATFICKAAGHRMTKDYGKGPISKRVPASWLQQRARYWGMPDATGKRVGHVYGWCQQCQNAWDKESR
jgi:hypothetical protein